MRWFSWKKYMFSLNCNLEGDVKPTQDNARNFQRKFFAISPG